MYNQNMGPDSKDNEILLTPEDVLRHIIDNDGCTATSIVFCHLCPLSQPCEKDADGISDYLCLPHSTRFLTRCKYHILHFLHTRYETNSGLVSQTLGKYMAKEAQKILISMLVEKTLLRSLESQEDDDEDK